MTKKQTSQANEASVKQEQVHDILFNREIGWQEIIYDLINTEQLDPWDINITILADKYLEKLNALEEADFFVSSKVLLAAALLLRIKSEILLNKYIKSIDEILFQGKNNQDDTGNRIGLETGSVFDIEAEELIPELIPKSPMPRFRKVTLKELMESLDKAIATENRRIKKEITNRNALAAASFSLPKRKFSIKDKIREIYGRLLNVLKEEDKKHKVSFTDFIGEKKDERIISFSSLLHLENQKKVWLNQERHFEEIYIWLKHVYMKHNPDPFAELKQELETQIEEFKELDESGKKRLEKINKDFENPLGALFD